MCLGTANGITVKDGAVYRYGKLIHDCSFAGRRANIFAIVVAFYIIAKEA